MLNNYGVRYPRLLDPEEIHTFYIEDKITASPLLRPGLLLWNPEEFGSGLDFSLKVEAELDLGTAFTDPLQAGLFTATVVSTVTVPAGTLKFVDLQALTIRWLSTYTGQAATASWKVRHKVTVTSLFAIPVDPDDAETVRVQALITGEIEDIVDSTKRPLFALNTPFG